MNLKKIEIFGFKSFADRTVIDFNDGITCVVGPNGSGKSNVADSIRWVLGEQSAKTLRGKNMQDVIFGGTVNRKSLSYCEVSLFFDNSDKRYPIEYDEVVITRKLYRTGDSEYYINKNQCRLKDILDLFRDTGLGREGYSIIGQGKIDQILDAKPDNRRKIFEEAAGIAKHKVRKIETERKLEATRDNLARLNDIIQEISSSLAPLEKESKDAEKAREIKSELKGLEVNHFIFQTENSVLEKEKIIAKIFGLQSKVIETDALLKQCITKYNLDMADINNSDIMSAKLSEERTTLMVNAEKLAGDNRVLTERLSNLQEEGKKIDATVVEFSAKQELQSKELLDKETLFKTKNEQFVTCNLELINIQKQYDQLVEEVDIQEKEIEKSTSLIREHLGKLTELKTNTVKLTATRDVLKDKILAGKEEIKTKNTELNSVLKERSGYQTQLSSILLDKEDKQKQKSKADDNYYASIRELNEAEKQKSILTNRITEMNVKINMLEEYKKEFSGYPAAVRRLVLEGQRSGDIGDKILGVVGHVINVPKDLQIAIEVALGGSIQNVITENWRDTSYLIDFLKRVNGGRATFLPIDAVKPFPLDYSCQKVLDDDAVVGVASELIKYDKKFSDIFSNLLGRTIVVEDKNDANRIAKKFNNAFRIVTLDGDLFTQSGAVTAGSQPSNDSRLLSRESELEDLTKKLKNSKNELNMMLSDAKDLARESEELQKATKVLEAQIHRLDVEIGAFNEKVGNFDSQAATIRAAIDNITKNNKELEAKISEFESLIKYASQEEGSIQNEGENVDDFLLDAKTALFAKKQERDDVNSELKQILIKTTALKNELDELDRDISRLNSDTQFAHKTLLDAKARKGSITYQITELEKRIDTAVFNTADKIRIEYLQNELKEIETHKKTMQEELSVLDKERSTLTEELSQFNEKKIREEGYLERIDQDLVSLSTKIQENYDLDYNTSLELRVDNFESDKALVEINRLKKQLDKLGPINELAIERFKEESIRFVELKSQYDEMSIAEQDLVKVVFDLSNEMREKFKKNFDIINENFKEISRDIFGGGRGKLNLDMTETDDILDADIDIFIEPPGKRLLNISALSGGERALTAIAILFAIIKLRPMPFCVLDEIEAALDDANANLFAQYLRKFALNTQFIVITHRKPTMELADTLFGVTMQERGVSKMVSVKLAELIKQVN